METPKATADVLLPKWAFEGAKPIIELLKEIPEQYHKEFFEFVPAHGKNVLVSRLFLDKFKKQKGISDENISRKAVDSASELLRLQPKGKNKKRTHRKTTSTRRNDRI